MKEIPIPSFNGRYLIDEVGKVYDKEKKGYIHYRMNHREEPHVYLPYLNVNLNGKSYSVHRLMALTYLPNPENKKTVDHIDRNTLNNNINNLRWATAKEQNNNQNFRPKNRHIDMLPIAMCDIKTGEILRTFPNLNTAQSYIKKAKGYSTSRQGTQIKLCCQNKTKSALGYKWKYLYSYEEKELW